MATRFFILIRFDAGSRQWSNATKLTTLFSNVTQCWAALVRGPPVRDTKGNLHHIAPKEKKPRLHKQAGKFLLSFVFGRFSPSPGSHGRSLGAAELELQAVGDEGDEFAVRRLALRVRHGVAEEALQRLQVAAVPRDLDGVADGALDARGRRGERLGHLRIEHLGDGVDNIHVIDGNQDRLPEILIALDVRRDADLVNDRGDHGLDVGVALCCDGGFARNGALADLVETLHDGTAAAWFQHDILHAERHKH